MKQLLCNYRSLIKVAILFSIVLGLIACGDVTDARKIERVQIINPKNNQLIGEIKFEHINENTTIKTEYSVNEINNNLTVTSYTNISLVSPSQVNTYVYNNESDLLAYSQDQLIFNLSSLQLQYTTRLSELFSSSGESINKVKTFIGNKPKESTMQNNYIVIINSTTSNQEYIDTEFYNSDGQLLKRNRRITDNRKEANETISVDHYNLNSNLVLYLSGQTRFNYNKTRVSELVSKSYYLLNYTADSWDHTMQFKYFYKDEE